MPDIYKDPYKILCESSKCECDEEDLEDLALDDAEEELTGEMDPVDAVDDDIVYGEAMIPVIRIGDDYVVESDMLAKYIDSHPDVEISEALNRIATHESNMLTAGSIGILIESDDYTDHLIQEAKAAKRTNSSKKKIKKIKDTASFLKDIKNKGIKVFKKKSKKSK